MIHSAFFFRGHAHKPTRHQAPRHRLCAKTKFVNPNLGYESKNGATRFQRLPETLFWLTALDPPPPFFKKRETSALSSKTRCCNPIEIPPVWHLCVWYCPFPFRVVERKNRLALRSVNNFTISIEKNTEIGNARIQNEAPRGSGQSTRQ